MNHWQRRAIIAANEDEGVNIEVAEYPGWKFRIGRDCGWNARSTRAVARVSAMPKYAALLRRVAEPDFEMTDADHELDREMTLYAFVEGLVMGWEGVTDEAGKPMKFTAANARKVLQSFPDIYLALRRECRNVDNFAKRTTAEKEALAGGNSATA